MESRERDAPRRQVGHSLSSLIVRPSESEAGGGSDYEPGEVRRDNPSRSDFRSRFGKTKGYGIPAGSVSPFRRRKVDHRYGMHAGSISPLHQRNVDKHYRTHAGSLSPVHHRNVNKHPVMDPAASASPLRHRTVDQHCVIGAGSVLALRQRNGDGQYRICESSIPPLHQRNVDSHYGIRTGSISPMRYRKVDHRYNSEFDHPGDLHRGHGIRGERGLGRFRDASPPSFGRGRGSRSFERGFDGPEYGPSQFRGDGIRNNPNVSPREGDWICSDPLCGNLNFARRAFCNNCNRLRFRPGSGGPGGSPGRRYIGPPSPRGPCPRIPGPQMDRKPERGMNGFGCPTRRDWGRDNPRVMEMGSPPPRHAGRYPDRHIRKDRPIFREDDEFRGRENFDGPIPTELGFRGRGDGDLSSDRRCDPRKERRQPSPPPPILYRDHWVHNGRDRSRSPMRGGLKVFRRGAYTGRGRENRRLFLRRRIEDGY